jgi:DNA-binding beta-propeller fold protein YncE
MSGYSDTAPVLFDFPAGLATDAAGDVYVGDSLNSAVREIAPTGTVSTPAKGLPVMSPKGVVADAAGNLYVADTGNGVIRKINTTTTEVTTVLGVPGLHGVKLGVLPGGLNSPSYLALMPGSGTTLLVTDENAVLQIELP